MEFPLVELSVAIFTARKKTQLETKIIKINIIKRKSYSYHLSVRHLNGLNVFLVHSGCLWMGFLENLKIERLTLFHKRQVRPIAGWTFVSSSWRHQKNKDDKDDDDGGQVVYDGQIF